jgi:hypothetical protein
VLDHLDQGNAIERARNAGDLVHALEVDELAKRRAVVLVRVCDLLGQDVDANLAREARLGHEAKKAPREAPDVEDRAAPRQAVEDALELREVPEAPHAAALAQDRVVVTDRDAVVVEATLRHALFRRSAFTTSTIERIDTKAPAFSIRGQ